MSTTNPAGGDRPIRVRLRVDVGRYVEAMRRAWQRPIVEDPSQDDDRA